MVRKQLVNSLRQSHENRLMVMQPLKESKQSADAETSLESIKKVDNQLFRQEAITSYTKGVAADGSVFTAEPEWVTVCYWVLVVGVLLLMTFILFGSVHDYAAGPAVVNIGEQVSVTAVNDATISQVLVKSGQSVKSGQPLVQLYQGQTVTDYERLKKLFELRLRQRLTDPEDVAVESALISVRAELALAEANLEERIVYAGIDGNLGDVRLRPGQRVSAGQELFSIQSDSDNSRVIAFLPGRYRPQLTPGNSIKLEVDGYPYAFQYLPIETIGDEIIGPAEARYFLGSTVADGMTIDGAVFIVEASLPLAHFDNEGKRYNYHDGMHGNVEVKVSSERIIVALFPGLKKIL